MTDHHLEQARRWKAEGHSLTSIRNYLENAGATGEEISAIIRLLDDEEVAELLYRQRRSRVRAEFLAGCIFLAAGVIYNLYRKYLEGEDIMPLTLLIPAGTFYVLYMRYRDLMRQPKTTRQLMREAQQHNLDRRNGK